jgi:hypothetical protein
MKTLNILLFVIFGILFISSNYFFLTEESKNIPGIVVINSILAASVGIYVYKTYIQKKD